MCPMSLFLGKRRVVIRCVEVYIVWLYLDGVCKREAQTYLYVMMSK